MSLGQRIKEARKKAQLTQAQLAEILGLSTITIRQYESDKRQPRLEQLRNIGEVLGVNWYELYSNDVIEQEKAKYELVFDLVTTGFEGREKEKTGDLFVDMFNSEEMQELGRRGIEIEEKNRKHLCEQNGQPYTETNQARFEKRAMDHIFEILINHGIFPKGYGSLRAVGYSKVDAVFMLEFSKSITQRKEQKELEKSFSLDVEAALKKYENQTEED